MTQGLQIIGAVLLLAGFAAAQWGALPTTALAYLAMNTVGAAGLAVLALDARAWGFLLLEGAWAAISLAGVIRRFGLWRQGSGWPRRLLRPEPVAVGLTGDELSEPGRVMRLFRDSYTASQGRQWMQAHVLWWILLFLRGHGVRPDRDLLAAPHLADTVTTLPLPPGHQPVHPPTQVTMNFQLWWTLLADLLRAAYPHRWPGWRDPGGLPPHDVEHLDQHADRVGLRPWMSSATWEELAGISHALEVVDREIRHGHTDPDGFMIRVLLPELLIVELRWLHIAGGRPRDGIRPSVEVLLLRQYAQARSKRAEGRQLTPLNYLYLHAGDLLEDLPSAPEDATDPHVRRVVELYRELRAALPDEATPEESGPGAGRGHAEEPAP